MLAPAHPLALIVAFVLFLVAGLSGGARPPAWGWLGLAALTVALGVGR